MLNEQLLSLIIATSEILELENSVIEKDYFVTQVIHALSKVENDYFRLVFCGGTCLAKAYKIVNRMSEDIDFKIQLKKLDVHFSKTRFLKELKAFRTCIKTSLGSIQGLIAGESLVRNEGKYSRIEIDYPSVFPVSTRLRPHILLEFTVSDILLPVTTLPIKALIEETLKNVIIFTPSLIDCISIDETAIEKWVGLTRRIAAIYRAYHPDDETLIRHVYDLNAMKQAKRINANFFTLAKSVVSADAIQFKNQHPEYAADPAAEIQFSLALLKNDPAWKVRYQKFIEEMVYDNTPAEDYENSIAVIEQISTIIISSLSVTKDPMI